MMKKKVNWFTLLMSFLSYGCNCFKFAFDESIIVGKYLAHLIADSEIFKDCVINLIGFSLGTVVILNCVKELDKIYEVKKVKHINKVVLMGELRTSMN